MSDTELVIEQLEFMNLQINDKIKRLIEEDQKKKVPNYYEEYNSLSLQIMKNKYLIKILKNESK